MQLTTEGVPGASAIDERPKRRLPLIGTISFVTVLLFGAVPIFRIWWPYHLEQSVIEEIDRLGGNSQSQRGGPDWLRKRVGDEYMTVFDRVTSVNLSDCDVNDHTMLALGDLEKLRELHLSRTKVTDAGLRHLSHSKQLDQLWLNGTLVTDSGLQHLRGLESLTNLWLNNTGVTDAGLEKLNGLTGLRKVWLFGTNVSEAGANRLRKTLPDCIVEHALEPQTQTARN